MALDVLLMLLVSVVMLGYLVLAMLKPENF